jgi:threonine synthase
MKYVSTGGLAEPVDIADALRLGAAPDGGLFVPESFPDLSGLESAPLPEFAAALLRPFFAGDALADQLPEVCAESFAPEPPLAVPNPERPQLSVLELFHGPTGAFKDYGARFLLALLDRIGSRDAPLTVLAATSGDTGAAVASAAEGRSGVQAVILFPKGRVSAFQKLQLSCWDAPVRSIEVEGDFDDCQRMVKACFQDAEMRERLRLTSANSINIGRLLPQAAYLAHAAVRAFEQSGVEPGFIIPTGNFGHALAALFARALGLPIGPVIAVTNANQTLLEWHRSGVYTPRASVTTIANAMDVGAPSNFERLASLPEHARQLFVEQVDDDTIRDRVIREYRSSGYVWCPHSATAVEAFERLPGRQRVERQWIACATAHPFKFRETIEPLIWRTIDRPAALSAILDRRSRYETIGPRPAALAELLSVAKPIAQGAA